MKKNKTNMLRLVLLILIFHSINISTAIATTASEYEVKAAFIYNFTKLTQWIKGTKEKNYITLCIHHDHPFDNHIDKLSEKKALDKSIKIMKITNNKSIPSCDLLFIGKKNRALMDNDNRIFTSNSILTIGNYEGFVESGGIIGFYQNDDKINFNINIKKAKESDLLIDDRLLKYGNIYYD